MDPPLPLDPLDEPPSWLALYRPGLLTLAAFAALVVVAAVTRAGQLKKALTALEDEAAELRADLAAADAALTPPLPAGTTAAAAQAWCAADAACVAVTFEGPRDGPSAGAVYAKTAAGMAAFVANETGGWSTWARADPAAVWHVVWTGGQSNSVGTNSQTTGYPTWPTTTRMYPRQKTRPQPLTHPPTHPSS